jgi:hypothetical protein
VSLDGRSDLRNLVAGSDFLPLLVLYSWSFDAQDTGGSFGEIIETVAAKAIGISRPQPAKIAYVDSAGAAWTMSYHGPLVSDPPPATAADPESFSMQVASELGRLTAAADESLLRAICNWRADTLAATASADVAASLRGQATDPADTTTTTSNADAPSPASATAGGGNLPAALATIAGRYLDAAHAQPLADPWRVPPAIAALHGQGAERHAKPTVSAAASTMSVGAPIGRLPGPASLSRPTPSVGAAPDLATGPTAHPQSVWRPHPTRLAGAVPAPDRARALARRHQVAATAAVAPPPRVASFRKDVLALRRIALAQLLPDPALMPDESLQFFYVDADWINQFLAGACSVGAIGTSSQTLAAAVARVLTAATADDGLQLEPAPALVTGFLLRSKLISSWPTTVVRAFTTVPPDMSDPSTVDQLTPIRLETLNPSLLLGLFPGRPAVVWIEEPMHAIRQGVDPTAVSLRPPPPTGAASVVDIAALASTQTPPWTSGQLAAHLLLKPHRHIYRLT